MLVHVKTPHIDVQLSGSGAQYVIETLRQTYGEVEVSDEDEAVSVDAVEWIQELRKSRTQGDVLWCYRDNAGMTIERLSDLSGIAKSHISEMENNKRSIGVKSAKKLAAALNCDFHRFIV